MAIRAFGIVREAGATLRVPVLLLAVALVSTSCGDRTGASSSLRPPPAVRRILGETPALHEAVQRLALELNAKAINAARPTIIDLIAGADNPHIAAAQADAVLDLSARSYGLIGDLPLARHFMQTADTAGPNARSLALVAGGLLVTGFRIEVAPILERAESVARRGDTMGLASALAAVAIGHGQLQDWDRARRVARDIADPVERSQAQLTMGEQLIESGQQPQAVTVLADALQSTGEIDSRLTARSGRAGEAARLMARAGYVSEALRAAVADSRYPAYRSVARGAAEAGLADSVPMIAERLAHDPGQRFYALTDAASALLERGDTAAALRVLGLADSALQRVEPAYRYLPSKALVDLLLQVGGRDRALVVARSIDTAQGGTRVAALSAVAGALVRDGEAAAASDILTGVRAKMPSAYFSYSPFLSVAKELWKNGGGSLSGPFADSALVLARGDTSAHRRYLGLESIAEYYVVRGDTQRVAALLGEAQRARAGGESSRQARDVAKLACLAARAGLFDRARELVDQIEASDPSRPVYRLWVYSVILLEWSTSKNPAVARSLGEDYWRIPGSL